MMLHAMSPQAMKSYSDNRVPVPPKASLRRDLAPGRDGVDGDKTTSECPLRTSLRRHRRRSMTPSGGRDNTPYHQQPCEPRLLVCGKTLRTTKYRSRESLA